MYTGPERQIQSAEFKKNSAKIRQQNDTFFQGDGSRPRGRYQGRYAEFLLKVTTNFSTIFVSKLKTFAQQSTY